MIKPPGTFSQKYMSNPVGSRLSKDRNKENKNLNGTFDGCDIDFTVAISQSNTPAKNSSDRLYRQANNHYESKFAEQWKKKEKELNETINRLKRQKIKMKEGLQEKERELKLIKASNQQNICSYEQYIKQMVVEKQNLQQKLTETQQYLQYAIIWLIEIFSNSIKTNMRMQGYLSKQHFANMFKKLKPAVSDLQIQEKLEEISHSKINSIHKSIYSELNGISFVEEQVSSQPDRHYLLDEAQSFLDTFDQRKEPDEDKYPQIAKKLFNDSFQVQEKVECRKSGYKEGERIVAIRNYSNGNDDYLQIKQGEQVKLLKKIGEVWIGESGSKIGYVEQSIFE